MAPYQPKPYQLATWNPERDLWETGMEDIFGHSDVYSETWPASGMTLNGVAYELPTWAPHTDDSESSYSANDETLLLTPVASEGTKPSNTMGVARRLTTGQVFLTNQIVTLCGLDPSEKLLRTPCAAEAEGGPRNPERPGSTMRLSDQVREEAGRGLLLPTPAAMNPNDGESLESWEARRARVKLTAKNGNGFGKPLAIAALELAPTGDPTPRLYVDGKPCEEPPLPLPN